jgi:hypothetical protein
LCLLFIIINTSAESKFNNFSIQQAREHALKLKLQQWLIHPLPASTICSSSSWWETQVCVSKRTSSTTTNMAV